MTDDGGGVGVGDGADGEVETCGAEVSDGDGGGEGQGGFAEEETAAGKADGGADVEGDAVPAVGAGGELTEAPCRGVRIQWVAGPCGGELEIGDGGEVEAFRRGGGIARGRGDDGERRVGGEGSGGREVGEARESE